MCPWRGRAQLIRSIDASRPAREEVLALIEPWWEPVVGAQAVCCAVGLQVRHRFSTAVGPAMDGRGHRPTNARAFRNGGDAFYPRNEQEGAHAGGQSA